MIPIQKAKEIINAFANSGYLQKASSIKADFNEWISKSPQAAALLSGEDWISVEDRLPELIDPTGIESAELKVKFEDGTKGNAWFHVNKGWCAWGIGKDNLPVTHWKNG